MVEGWCCGIFALHCSSGGGWCGPRFAHLSGPFDFAALVASSLAPAARHEVRARARAPGQSGRVCHTVCHSPPPQLRGSALRSASAFLLFLMNIGAVFLLYLCRAVATPWFLPGTPVFVALYAVLLLCGSSRGRPTRPGSAPSPAGKG